MPVKVYYNSSSTYNYIYAAVQDISWNLSGTTLTLSGFSYADGTGSYRSTSSGINVIAYKNS